MAKLFSSRSKTDPALARYPDVMGELIRLGQGKKDLDYGPLAQRYKDHVPDLLRMVFDDDLNERAENDPAVWAPYHALQVLGVLGPAEAAEPLLDCLDIDDDWFREALPEVYADIGPAAVPLLQAYLSDSGHDAYARGSASGALAAIAQAHPEARADIVAFLTAFLDRPRVDVNADEEHVTTSVITDLGDLKATTAYEAIRRAFAENRVDEQIVALEDIERDFGMRPPLDFNKPTPRTEPGVRLVLKCKVCGREREHVFRRVYYDLGTANDEKKREKYDPIVIPERVTCPKCGAVDQYELGGMGHIAILASLLASKEPGLAANLRPDQRVQPLTFTTRWGPMHPLEAVERYQRELAWHPNDVSLHVGFGSVYRVLGRTEEAYAEFQKALSLDPRSPDAWVNLAQMATARHDQAEAIRCWEQVAALSHQADLPPDERSTLAQAAEENLADLRQGVFAEIDPVTAPAVPRVPAGRKVGRNDPCPCGSGKKYKHCHGRKG